MSQSQAKMQEMSGEELLGFFKSFCPEMKISSADLTACQPEKTQEIYRWFVKRLTGCKDVDLVQMNYRVTQMGYFEYPELHQNSYSLVTLTLAINYIMSGFEVTTFFIADLIRPKPKRTVRYFGLLARFAQFTRNRSPIVENILQKVQFVKDERVSLRKENDDLKEKISKLKVAEAEKEPLCQKLTVEGEKLRTDLEKESQLQVTLDAKSGVLAEKIKLAQNSLEKLKTEAEKLRSESKKLGSMIVSSPKKYFQQVEVLKQKKMQLEKEAEAMQEQLIKFTEKRETINTVDSMVDDLRGLNEEVNEELNSQKSLKMSIKPLADSIIRLQHKIADMELTVNERRRLLENANGITARQKQSHLSQMNGLKTEISSGRSKLDSVKETDLRQEMASKEINAECERIEKEIEAKKIQTKTDIKLLQEKTAELIADGEVRTKEYVQKLALEKEDIIKATQIIKDGGKPTDLTKKSRKNAKKK